MMGYPQRFRGRPVAANRVAVMRLQLVTWWGGGRMLSKFDVAVLKAPEPWKSAAIEVCDTLHVVNMACQDEFGEAATPELVWTITKAVLARADRSNPNVDPDEDM